jgi:hypothetical protein
VAYVVVSFIKVEDGIAFPCTTLFVAILVGAACDNKSNTHAYGFASLFILQHYAPDCPLLSVVRQLPQK